MRWSGLTGVISSLRLSKRRSLSTQREDLPILHGEKLDFMTAAKILFTTPPKPKKFGYTPLRRPSDKLTKEWEMKKKAEEETKEKGLVSDSAEAGLESHDPELTQVKKRLDALEKSVEEIVDKTGKSLSQKGEDQSSSKLENVIPSDRNKKSGSDAATQTGSSSAESKVTVSTSGTVQESVVKSSPPVISVDKDGHRGKDSDKKEKC